MDEIPEEDFVAGSSYGAKTALEQVAEEKETCAIRNPGSYNICSFE